MFCKYIVFYIKWYTRVLESFQTKLHLRSPPDPPPLLAPATKNIFPDSPRPPFLTEEVRKDCWKDLQNLLVKITRIYTDCAYTYSDTTKQNIQYLWCMFLPSNPLSCRNSKLEERAKCQHFVSSSMSRSPYNRKWGLVVVNPPNLLDTHFNTG